MHVRVYSRYTRSACSVSSARYTCTDLRKQMCVCRHLSTYECISTIYMNHSFARSRYLETWVQIHQDVSVDMNAHAFSMDLCVCMCGWVGVFVRAGFWLGD